jgi:hypothetical protein
MYSLERDTIEILEKTKQMRRDLQRKIKKMLDKKKQSKLSKAS